MANYSFIKNLNIWDHYSYRDAKLVTRIIPAFPFIQYPNGMPCYEANLYLLNFLKKGHSTLNKGSISKYASNISHLVNYCYENKISKFSELNDNHITDLIKKLIFETNPITNFRVRQNNQVITIGTQCLDFLFFVQYLYNFTNLIGTKSSFKIKVIYKSKDRRKRSKRSQYDGYYIHQSFPHQNNKKTRVPVSFHAIKKLREYIKSNYERPLAFRHLCMVETLEFTGARRAEVCLIKVQDVIDALKSSPNSPSLKLTTLKNKKNQQRFVPVPRNFLENLSIYLRFFRKAVISKTIGLENDHGFLFISHTSGLPLTPDTVTTYFNNWGKILNENVHPHAFRHLFITEKLKLLILKHNYENIDDFRHALLNTDMFKKMLQQWTGHSAIQSLDNYINLAFSDLGRSEKLKDDVQISLSITAFKDRINFIKDEIRSNPEQSSQLVDELTKAIDLLNQELKGYREI